MASACAASVRTMDSSAISRACGFRSLLTVRLYRLAGTSKPIAIPGERLPTALKHHHAVRTSGPGLDVAVEVEVEGAIELQTVATDVDHVDLVITLDVHDAPWGQVLDEEVIGDHEPLLVLRQPQEVRPGIATEVDDAHQLGAVRARDVEHGDLAGPVQRHEQAGGPPGHPP